MKQDRVDFTEKDINEFARKLEVWASELQPKEAALLRYLVNAPSNTDQVTPYRFLSISVVASSRLSDVIGKEFIEKQLPKVQISNLMSQDAVYW